MLTHDIRITRILYMYIILRFIFYFLPFTLLEWSGYPSEQPRQQTISHDRHRPTTFAISSLDRVILFTAEATSIQRLEHVSNKVRCITTPMLYHYATPAAVHRIIKINNKSKIQI